MPITDADKREPALMAGYPPKGFNPSPSIPYVHQSMKTGIDPRQHPHISKAAGKYQHADLISKVPCSVLKMAARVGLPKPKDDSLCAVCLSLVGEEYLQRKSNKSKPPTLTATEEHLAHDLICAEAMIKMRAVWKVHVNTPGLVEVLGSHKVAIWDPEKMAHIVAPDEPADQT